MTVVSYRSSSYSPIEIPSSEAPDQLLENSACLSNGRMVKILEGEIETKAMELPLNLYDMKRDMHYNSNIAHFLMGAIATIGWEFLRQYLFSTYNNTYSLERTPEYFYGEDSLEIKSFNCIEYAGFIYLAEKSFNICSIQLQLRKQRQQFNLTKEKISALIKKLKPLNPVEPLLASSLPDYASEIDFYEESFEAMIDRMNFNQIKNLQRSLGEKFYLILKARVLDAFFPFR